MLREVVGTDHHAHAPRDLAHGLEERETPTDLHRFVGDRGRPGRDERLGESPVGGEVEIREEDLSRPQHRDFGGLRLFHLYDDAATGKNIGRAQDDFRPGGAIFRIGIGGSETGAGLHQDSDPLPYKLASPARG